MQRSSDLLEQEAGYLDLRRSLTWKKHEQPQLEVSRGLSAAHSARKVVKEKAENCEEVDHMDSSVMGIERAVEIQQRPISTQETPL